MAKGHPVEELAMSDPGWSNRPVERFQEPLRRPDDVPARIEALAELVDEFFDFIDWAHELGQGDADRDG